MSAPRRSQAGRRGQRECPLCGRVYYKLTDHLKKTHRLTTGEERRPYMIEAFKKNPDLRIQSKHFRDT
jgi:hypothetical protein